MSAPQFPPPEQDSSGDGDLPTYDFLAAEAGPNSRFGRWKGWVEKRAAERYVDLTPEETARRKQRGWGEGVTPVEREPGLRIQTNSQDPPTSYPLAPPASSPPPVVGEIISPTHLLINQFGSRFLPHTTAPIRCVLPLLSDSLILIGHDDGLSVLNMFPKEWTEDGLADSGPSTASARVIWEGEAVYQMTLLEVEEIEPGAPTGVVLALVGSSTDDEDVEGIKSLRMYTLSSLTSLAKWTASHQYSGPLNLRHPPCEHPRRGSKKSHIPHVSISKGLKSLTLESSTPVAPFDPRSLTSVLSTSSSQATLLEDDSYSKPIVNRSDSDGSTASWDLIEDLPLRWASDYVPLSNNSGSRLAHTNVLFYETWSDESSRGQKGTLLAIATKSAILLYETPKGERSFRFVKEFYTPLSPRAMNFVYQAICDPISRSPSDVGPTRIGRTSPSRIAAHTSHQRSTSSVVPSIRYSNQLSLFVIFDKKAGLIRIADSVVGEVELLDEGSPLQHTNTLLHARDAFLSPTNSLPSRRNRTSWDGFGFIKDKANWIPPTKVDLAPSIPYSNVYLLTRAKCTHVLPYPLPYNLCGTPSYRVLYWNYVPKRVEVRVCNPSPGDEPQLPFLQLISFGEHGIEIQEIPLHSLLDRKGKSNSLVRIQGMEDLGGETAPLCPGGHWHRAALHSELSRFSSVLSTNSANFEPDELIAKLKREQGIYGWVQKGLSDWRLFWVGGTGSEEDHRVEHWDV